MQVGSSLIGSLSADKKPEYKPSFFRTNWFEAVQKEYSLVSEKVGLIDLTPFAKIKVSGIDARAYLDYLLAEPSLKLAEQH